MEPLPLPRSGEAPSFPARLGPRPQAQAEVLLRWGRWALFLGLPFFIVSWLMPFVPGKTIGNDYSVFSFLAQLDLMWSLHRGNFPLYMPGFSVGHSTAAMTLGQLYHPLSWIASFMPGYWSGLALEWNTFLRLLSLGFVHLLLFRLCRRLCVQRLPAFLCTLLVVYNLRMLDSFRYGAALEGYTGMLLVAGAAVLVFLDEDRQGRVVLLSLSVYLLATSGHPQWFFLGLLGAFFWVALLPWLLAAISPFPFDLSWPRLRRYFCRVSLGIGAGLALAMPYLLTFTFEFFSTNQSRAGNTSYEWTLGYSDGLRGELSNFLFPLHSDVHGAFGGSALFLIAAMLPVGALLKRPPWALVLSYGFAALALFFAAGSETPFHRFVVEHVPFLGSARTPGRLVLWIPLACLPILAWMFRPSNRRVLVISTLGAVITALWFALHPSAILPKKEDFSPMAILGSAIPRHYDPLILYAFLATALILLTAALWRAARPWCLALATAAVLGTTWLCLSVGTWQVDKAPSSSQDQMNQQRAGSTSGRSAGGEGFGMEMRSVTAYRQHNLDPVRPLGRLFHRAMSAESDESVLRQMVSDKSNRQQIFIDGPAQQITPTRVAAEDVVILTYNTSNRFTFDVSAAQDGTFVLGLPWLPGFVCRVDGRLTPVVRADALNPAVFLTPGRHSVDFMFVSWPFLLGLGLALISAAGLTVWYTRGARRRVLAKVWGLSLVPMGLLVWFLLYAGPSFGTNFVWRAPL